MSKHPLYNTIGLQKNNKSHVLYALANKQMELKQLEDEYQAKISKIKSDLEAMNQVICLFDGNCSETIKKLDKRVNKTSIRKKNSYFRNGEAKSIILKILKNSLECLSTEQISKKAIEIQGLDIDDKLTLSSVGKTVVNILRTLESNNIVFNDTNKSQGKMLFWSIR